MKNKKIFLRKLGSTLFDFAEMFEVRALNITPCRDKIIPQEHTIVRVSKYADICLLISWALELQTKNVMEIMC